MDICNNYLENLIDWSVRGAKLRNKETLDI